MTALARCVVLACCLMAVEAAVGREQALKDAQGVWKGQDEFIVESRDGSPWFTGSYVWGGRADEEYLAFHQWELRLAAGTADRQGWRMRILPLDGHFNVQRVVKPHWQDIPDTAAGEQATVSYKLNSSSVVAYRVEIELDPKTTLSYLANNQVALPQPETPGDTGAVLVASNSDFSYDRRRGMAKVTYFLANIGDAPAEEVRVVIHFLDRNDKAVHQHRYTPGDKRSPGVLEAGFRNQERLIVRRVPPFHSIRVSTSKREPMIIDLVEEGGEGASDLAVTALAVKDGVLHATVVNRSQTALKNLVVTIELLDADGAVVAQVPLTAAALEAGAETELTAEVGAVTFSGYTMGFSFE